MKFLNREEKVLTRIYDDYMKLNPQLAEIFADTIKSFEYACKFVIKKPVITMTVNNCYIEEFNPDIEKTLGLTGFGECIFMDSFVNRLNPKAYDSFIISAYYNPKSSLITLNCIQVKPAKKDYNYTGDITRLN